MQPVILSDLKGVDRKTLNALKRAGIESLEDLKLIDALQFSTRTGIPQTNLDDILLRAELEAYKTPPTLADALVSCKAISRLGELPAFSSEEILSILAEDTQSFDKLDIGIEDIEVWRSRLQLMSLDEETIRGVQIEDSSSALFDEEGPSLCTEEPVILKQDIKLFHEGLERSYQTFSDAIEAIKATPEGTIDILDLQTLFLDLQSNLHSVFKEAVEKLDPDLGIVQNEDEGTVLADEEIEFEEEIKVLTKNLNAMQDQLAELQLRQISADEELSPALSAEGEPTEVRGE